MDKFKPLSPVDLLACIAEGGFLCPVLNKFFTMNKFHWFSLGTMNTGIIISSPQDIKIMKKKQKPNPPQVEESYGKMRGGINNACSAFD
jgi:hypothetical protein